MPKHSILLGLVIIVMQSHAQNFKQQFADLCSRQDTAAQVQLLKKWQKASPNDAELFIAYFNYYFSKSKIEMVQLTADAGAGPSIQLTDSAGNSPVGYLTGAFDYDVELLQQGIKYIDMGINKYPARLDMRLGKIYALGQVEEYEQFTKEIIRAITIGRQISNRWLWSDNKKIDNPERFLLSNIQDYVVQLYNVGDDQLPRMRKIAETILKYYPSHVESLSNLAITYILQKNYNSALPPLLKAEKIAPKDYVVLNNIANVYERKGDRPNAIRYYQLTVKYGDSETKTAAVKKLKELGR